MVQYIETDNRVFRVALKRLRKARRWRISATQVAGSPLPDEEWDRLVSKMVAEAVSLGAKNIRWKSR